jgi:hypothetical protein
MCSADAVLSAEDLKGIAEAKEDIRAGRIYTTEKVRKLLHL